MKRTRDTIRRFWHNAGEYLPALIYPPRCGGCGKLLAPGQSWCSECWTSLALAMGREYCPTCAAPLGPHQGVNLKGKCFNCKKLSLPISGVCRLGGYEGVLADVICEFKYSKNTYKGTLLAGHLAQCLYDQDWLEEIDALCPIPIHWTRRLARGFNQAGIIARQLADETRLPLISLLRRVRPTPQQVGLSASARVENIKGAFRVKRFRPIEGASLCLVDDVMTTGATLHEAARTLKRAGAKAVYAAVLAKAEHSFFPRSKA